MISLAPALSGAIFYFLEKMALEPLMHRYESALRRFAATAAHDLTQTLAFDLGRDALAENAEWLIMHRERPIKPMISG